MFAVDPDRRAFGVGLIASALAATSAVAQQRTPPGLSPSDWSQIWPPREVIPLWPDRPPGRVAAFEIPAIPAGWTGGAWPASFLRRTSVPTLNVFRPARPNGAALLVCPGGSYVFVSAANEGVDVARVFNAIGVTVFVLSYRLPGEGWRERADVPLQDAQRAMRLIRQRAWTFGIRPDTVGVLGFSAGGQLAATLAADHAEQVYLPVDAADRESARPAYAGLIYPVILTSGAYAHARAHGIARPVANAGTADASLSGSAHLRRDASLFSRPCSRRHDRADREQPRYAGCASQRRRTVRSASIRRGPACVRHRPIGAGERSLAEALRSLGAPRRACRVVMIDVHAGGRGHSSADRVLP
ncbi:alpha/beta hydrolase [Sphingomonas sp. BIUV-7]|uniref:Alpha/beta hydrolase n=1 Tax=Sphingomonas natans TaxID=3063330 RepID=A0ABT8YD86_9SPHN|nr:alpha/beta hydrolase [Sphingomonas sp. BIUV-7]MDO6416284.1 alpha/beta hydrolase [Sphingomonas sp. BIUV-7]